MIVNVLIDGLTADGQVYRAGRVENPGPQLLQAVREKRKWGDRLMVELIEEASPEPIKVQVEDYSKFYEVQGDSYTCKLCGYTTTDKYRITGHLTMKHFKRKGVSHGSNGND
jgi:predicted nucleic-acid-binding Zn-ribbon protein